MTSPSVPTPLALSALAHRLAEVTALCAYLGSHLLGDPAPTFIASLLDLTAMAWALRLGLALTFRAGRIEGLSEVILDATFLGFLMLTGPNPGVAVFVLLIRRAVQGTSRLAAGRTGAMIGPATLLILTFLTPILVGGFLLSMPLCHQNARTGSLLDALFTATSAICVTGLAVYDVGTTLSRWGQLILVLLIQVGGLGVMTVTTWVAVTRGKRLFVADRKAMQLALGSDDFSQLGDLLASVLRLTLLFEAVGALILWASFLEMGLDPLEALWHGVFHAVSAFCNAGFGLRSDSLVAMRASPVPLATVALLIVAGGLGFGNVRDLLAGGVARLRGRRPPPLSATSRVVVSASGLLLLGGALGYFFVEHGRTLSHMTLFERLLNSAFCSVTARTAGFNTVDYAQMGTGGYVLTMFLMFVGGGPGGTAGGIKVTTAVIALACLRSVLGRERTAVAAGRKVPIDVMLRALALVLAWALVIGLGTLVMAAFETSSLDELAFEATSAMGTVGLSMGITSKLEPVSKVILMVLMFLGRVGPAVLTVLWGEERPRGIDRLPVERFPIG